MPRIRIDVAVVLGVFVGLLLAAGYARRTSDCRWEPRRIAQIDHFGELGSYLPATDGLMDVSFVVGPEGRVEDLAVDAQSEFVASYVKVFLGEWTFRRTGCRWGAQPKPNANFVIDYSFDSNCAGDRRSSCRQVTEFELPDKMYFRERLQGLTDLLEDDPRYWRGVELPPALRENE